MGLAKSINDAINIADGKYIVRMDSDDISLKNRVKQQVRYMEKHKDIMISYMRAICFDKANGIKYTFNSKPSEIDIQLLYMNCVVHPAVIIRKKYLDDNCIKYNENYMCSQDYELWSRIVNSSNISELKKVGLLYRVHNTQISNQKQKIQVELKEKIIKDNNIEKIDVDIDRLNTLMQLSGSEEVTMENYESLIKSIDNLLEKNVRYDKKILKKVLYNRIFQIIMAKKELRKNILSILFNKNAAKVIFMFNNLNYILVKVIMKVKAYFSFFIVIKYKSIKDKGRKNEK